MKTIGFIGIDPISAALARFSVKVGWEVIVSDIIGPHQPDPLAAALGNSARADSAEECANESDLVVIAVPLERISSLPASALRGKVVADTTNYFPQVSGHIKELDDKAMTSSEYVQRAIEGAHVVKAFYNIDRWHLENGPRQFGSADRWALPIAGDDDSANAQVARWMGMIGFDPIYCGRLADTWRIQAGTSVFILPYVGFPPTSLTKEERRVWYRWDRSATVREDTIKKLAESTPKDVRPYAALEDFPSELMDSTRG